MVSNKSVNNLSKLYKSEKGADVHFRLKSNVFDGEMKVPAHKAIMAASSPVFDRMFFSELKKRREVKIKDVSFEGFCEFLQFFYMEKIELTAENIVEVSKLVGRYDMHECFDVCGNFVESIMTPESFCHYYELALTFNYPKDFIAKSENIFGPIADVIFKSSSFMKCGRFVLKRLLDMDCMQCSEPEVFEAAISWATIACEKKNKPPSPEHLKAELGDCLSLIRFPTMTTEEYASYMKKYPSLLDYHIFLDIFNHIQSKMPLTCGKYFNKNRRLKSKSVRFWQTNEVSMDREISEKSFVSFTACKDFWLNACTIVTSNTEKSDFACKIYSDGTLIQDFAVLYSRESDYLSHFNRFFLFLNEPFLCEARRMYKFCFELDRCLEKHIQVVHEMNTFDGVMNELKIENYFIDCIIITERN